MSIDATIFVWKLSKQFITPTEKLILLSFADRADEYGRAYPSIRRLVQDTLFDRKTIIKALKSLVEKGILIRSGEYQGRTNQVPIYQFNTDSFRENNSPNSSNNSNAPKSGTCPNSGTPTCPKSGTRTSTNSGTRNLKGNLKIESIKKKNIKKKNDDEFSVDNALADNPHEIEQELIEEWIEIRKKKHKASFTKRVWDRHNRVIGELRKKGISVFEIMDRLLTKQWQGIEESYFKDLLSLNQMQGSQPKPLYDDNSTNWIHMEVL